MEQVKDQKKTHGGALRVIRNVYLYLVTLIGLITFIMGSVGIINNVLQHYVFQVDDAYTSPVRYPGSYDMCSQPYPKTGAAPDDKNLIAPTTQEIADCRQAEKEQNEKANRANFGRELSISLAQILIGLPIWLFHWNVIQKEYKKREEEHES